MQKPQMNGLLSRVLFLSHMLISGEYTKKEIILEYLKNDVKVSRTSIDNYIKILSENGINVAVRKEKNKNLYSINLKNFNVEFDEKTKAVFQELKKILISQKDYYLIKNTVYLFYKLSLKLDKNISDSFANFGYFSNINWFLVNDLEKHCVDKDIIKIEYILPDGKSIDYTIHADKLIIRGSSDRLYLSGVLNDDSLFSYLPVDRIFMIKKVIRKKVLFDMPVKILKYTVSKNALETTSLEENEAIYEQHDEKVTISSLLTDEFLAFQRILHFCPDVYFISDEKIKSMVVDKLKSLEKMYEN